VAPLTARHGEPLIFVKMTDSVFHMNKLTYVVRTYAASTLAMMNLKPPKHPNES
jgi:hypothetical protein